jgi:hypothetical protein
MEIDARNHRANDLGHLGLGEGSADTAADPATERKPGV